MEHPEHYRHGLHEDALAMVLGTLFVALGTVIYAKATLLVGGIAGMALLLQYATGMQFWLAFSLINIPFYYLAMKRMGWRFAVRTFLAVSLVSLLSRLSEHWVEFSLLDPTYAAVLGGGLCGTGLLILFRHRTGLGGINILAIFLQETFGIRGGYFQLAVDLGILGTALFVLTPDHLMLSILGATIVNMVIAINHRPDRYLGVT
ncbi:YitT family protein [Mesorhizobium qingshengii]|uniref:YitT family protein n=1 Tax=Mesorhizobium qingshengii TaxID=1165689 RepID=A0ABT4R2K7_9HYPH|nr:YitT family protein [Mesorhizobium qingshengii]MCZ8547981.1 YitT family protein [Mesorhizobium qingshengii]